MLPETVDKIHDIVLVGRRVDNELHMKKLCATQVPRLLIREQKLRHMRTSVDCFYVFKYNTTDFLVRFDKIKMNNPYYDIYAVRHRVIFYPSLNVSINRCKYT